MIELAGSPDRVVPGHDMLQFQKFPTERAGGEDQVTRPRFIVSHPSHDETVRWMGHPKAQGNHTYRHELHSHG